jgi:asparagine synthase (glutamine-hydrolysing)
MCGIAGIFHLKKQDIELSKIDQMVKDLHHRGPDDHGIEKFGHLALGFVRLSIIDLSPAGHQPMQTTDGRYTITFNGEIFNYLELRQELEQLGHSFITKTDTEVLLKSYVQWGKECLHRFNGMWAFVIYDQLLDQLFAARDRFGVKPFYYVQEDDILFWCSEIPPLLRAVSTSPAANEQAVFDYLVFNRTDQTEATFFKNIYKLQHGCTLTIDRGQIEISKWYDLRKQVKLSSGFKSAHEFLEAFKSSIQLRLRSDVPIGVCLSGGLDSSAIVSTIVQDFGIDNLQTFSAVYKKGDVGDESTFIQELSKLVPEMHKIYPDGQTLMDDLDRFISAHAEPIPSTGPYAQFKVMELAKGKVVVTLDGQGADEELAGYHYFFGFYFKDLFLSLKWLTLCKELYWNYKHHKSLLGVKSFLYFLLPSSIKTKSRVSQFNLLHRNFVAAFSTTNSVAGNIYGSKSLNDALLDHFEYKLEHLLKWEDRNSMFFSLEARVPFLDYRLVEKTLASSADKKIKNGMTKAILREAMMGKLSEKIRVRKDKTGFDTPQDRWFREDKWVHFMYDIFQSEEFRSREIVNVDRAIGLLRAHQAGKIKAAKELWKLLHLELWYRKFIDRKV